MSVNEIIIGDHNYQDYIDPIVNGERRWCTATPRTIPYGQMRAAKPFDIDLIHENEWESRLAARIKANAQLSDIRNRGMNGQPIPSRDQDGKGYCWAHSTVSSMLICRAFENLPYADLSAYAVACIIKGYRNQGGWGGESLEFIAERGVPTAEFWPQQSMSRSNDNPKTWENAKLHRFTDWVDLDPSNMRAQFVTCLLLGIPVITDMDWWSHSICTVDLVSLNPFRTRIWNSWSDDWSDKGMGILEGRKAIPSQAWAPRLITASAA